MSVTRWDPFRDLEALRENVNRLVQESVDSKREHVLTRAWAPAVDVLEDADKILVRAELPGMKKEEIDIELTGDTLSIRGDRKFDDEDRKDCYVRVERTYGQFMRSFTIGVPVKANDVKASYKDGILEVTIPKADEIKPKKVEVAID